MGRRLRWSGREAGPTASQGPSGHVGARGPTLMGVPCTARGPRVEPGPIPPPSPAAGPAMGPAGGGRGVGQPRRGRRGLGVAVRRGRLGPGHRPAVRPPVAARRPPACHAPAGPAGRPPGVPGRSRGRGRGAGPGHGVQRPARPGGPRGRAAAPGPDLQHALWRGRCRPGDRCGRGRAGRGGPPGVARADPDARPGVGRLARPPDARAVPGQPVPGPCRRPAGAELDPRAGVGRPVRTRHPGRPGDGR